MSDVVTEEPGKAEIVTAGERDALLALSPEEAIRLRQWWQRLTLPPNELEKLTKQRSLPRGVRAVLRRCDSAETAMLTQGFRELWTSLPESTKQKKYREEQLQVWSCIALITAELREERRETSLATRLGDRKDKGGKPLMSELRFQQLISCRTPEEFIQRLRRALALADKKGVSVVLLASVISLWWREYRGTLSVNPSNRFSFVLAKDYFQTTENSSDN